MKDNKKWSGGKIFIIIFNCILCIAIVVGIMVTVIDKSRTKNGVVYNDKSNTTTISQEINKTTVK